MKKQEVASCNIHGIKCDHCTWKDMRVPYEDYPKWVNKSCPACGENLLTQKDYNVCKRFMNLTKFLNFIGRFLKMNDETVEKSYRITWDKRQVFVKEKKEV